ncbi:hypothetical protein P691DRAFT_812777 [Macrolepiota fuliginosa MF-IS2]|uniref:Uncharacterized protein n=1 Tax=Macrolepiota fuliginosa MF-IS2 TaxID=1400762 RepID=A0A9P5XGR9_9AGAR|nr:hypothetical protein P691DRAFT_812777 [Macrolepiota fuliginosa MF-IS2]
MKSFFAITTVLAALFATAIAAPAPVADAATLPLCPTSWPKNGGIGPVCQPRPTETPAPTATPGN